MSSLLRSFRLGLSRLVKEVQLFFRSISFMFIPNERNLLLSLWYDHSHYKSVKPYATVYTFLDSRIVGIKRNLEDVEMSLKKRQMYRDLLRALYQPVTRDRIIEFLKTPDPEEHYQTIVDMIYSDWRKEVVVKAVPEAGPQPSSQELAVQVEEMAEHDSDLLNAKTYIIAADLYFESIGQAREFKRLSNDLAAMEEFIREQFGVARLPGTFRKLKGYSFRKILQEKNDSRTGQLRPHFRQIIDNPQIFGDEIVRRARQIQDDYFV